MDRFPARKDNIFSIYRQASLWHLLGAILVVFYVNTYGIWTWVTQTTSRDVAQYLPFLLLAVTLVSFLGFLHKARSIRWQLLLAAIAIAIFALFLTDPDFPAKRIHVPQYFVLAIVIRYALSFDLPRDPWLAIATITLILLYGIHDELLQGFHPDRTFGLRDVMINILGGCSGSLFAAGLGLFIGPPTKSAPLLQNASLMTLSCIPIAAFLLVLPLEGYRGQTIPVWSTLPLLAAAVGTSLIIPGTVARSCAFRAFACVAFSLLLYPLASHVPPLQFH